jgi:3-oxoacyl-(acyl-carrier-protein) synthase
MDQPGGQAPSAATRESPGQSARPTDPVTPGNGRSSALADTSGGSSPAADPAATEAVKRTVTDALTKLAADAPKPATGQVTDALTGAGIAPGVLQVSQSRTPTGLEADAIEAAVLQGKDCVIGQVREGAVTVTILPVLASGKCFVGS